MALLSSLDVSVILCAYTQERWKMLIEAVQSLRHQSNALREIIIVVDHNPTLLERVRNELQDVLAIDNHEEQGLSGARNSGVAVARGALVAFMDEDAIAIQGWIDQLAESYSRPEIIGVGGAIVPRWQGGRPSWFPQEFDWVVGCTYRGLPTTATTVRNFIGCNMSFRRNALVDVGGFRNGIGRAGALLVGGEETELCIRITQRWPNVVLRYQPQAIVHHWVPCSRATWSYFVRRCYAEGLSKAQVVELVGLHDGLVSEWDYMLRTLPVGVMRNLAQVLRQCNGSGLQRVGAMAVGLAVTAVGYLHGKSLMLRARPAQRLAAALAEQAVAQPLSLTSNCVDHVRE